MLNADLPWLQAPLADALARARSHALLVQGPGAGPDVTAAGIFADLLRIAESLELRA